MRTPHLLIAAAVIVVGALLLMWSPWVDEADVAWRSAVDSAGVGAPITVDGGSANPERAGLAGRGADAGAPADERSPVTVTVVGHGGRRLAGVPVRLMGPAPGPEVDEAPVPGSGGHEHGHAHDAGVDEPDDSSSAEVSDSSALGASIVTRVSVDLPLVAVTSALTDADGVVVFADVPYDGTHAVELRRDGERFTNIFGSSVFGSPLLERAETDSDESSTPVGSVLLLDDVTSGIALVNGEHPLRLLNPGLGTYRHFVTGPTAQLDVPGGLPLRVRVESGERGRRVGSAKWVAGPRYLGHLGRPQGGHALVGVETGRTVRVSVDIEVPEGYVQADANVFENWISPEAQRLEARVPLRPEAQIVVVIKGDLQIRDPSKLEGTVHLTDASHFASDQFTLDGFGRLRVAGLPHLGGEPVQVELTYEGAKLSGAGRMGRNPSHPLVIEIEPTKLPEEGAESLLPAASFSDDLFDVLFGELALDRHVYREVVDADAKTTGRLAVRVLRADGAPVEGAVVSLVEGPQVLFTRADGRVLFEGLKPGKDRLAVLGAGAVAFKDVEIVAGHERSVEIRGDLGGRIRLEVFDEEGEPVPYAEITLDQASGWEWAEVVDGVQRVDPFTNHRGLRTLHRVEPGVATVNANFGSRYARTTVNVLKGRTVLLRLQLGKDTTSAEGEAETPPK